MLKFKGFKVTMNLMKNKCKGRSEETFEVSTTGVYRTNRDESFEIGRLSGPQKKITPSMVQLPPNTQHDRLEFSPSKSTQDLRPPNSHSPSHLSKSTPEISFDPRGGPSNSKDFPEEKRTKPPRATKNKDKEQNKLEKQRQAEQKKREKLVAQEQERAEKLRKENERQQRAKEENKRSKDKEKSRKKKGAAPKPPQLGHPPQSSQIPKSNPLAQAPVRYSTNTLESSISRSSGPPPYSEVPRPSVVPNQKDGSGNTSFSKSIDSSWDMISQHRQQINKPKITENRSRQLVMDLHYNAGNAPSISDEDKDSTA